MILGGAGHVADMITRMKQNRDLLKKKHYFKKHLKAGDYEMSNPHEKELSHEHATPKQLQKVRDEVRAERRKPTIKKVTILFVSLLILLIIIFYIRNLLDLSWIT